MSAKIIEKGLDSKNKKDILINSFNNSSIALIMGEAGTGKTELLCNYYVNIFKGMKILFISNTHTCKNNIIRRVKEKSEWYEENYKAKTASSISKNKYFFGEYDLVIIDECKSISNRDINEILKKINTKYLILAGDVGQVIVEGKHTPIISKEDFENVQKIIQEHSKHIEKGKKAAIGAPKSIWSKKLRCNYGSTFNRRSYHRYGDITTYCYQCYHQKNIGSARYRLKQGLDITQACDIKVVQEWKLKLMANVIFNAIWQDKEQIINLANQLIEEVINEDESISEIESEIKRLSIRIDNTNDKLKKLLNMYLDNLIDQEGYINSKKEFEEDLLKYKQEKEKLEVERGIPKDTLELRLKNLKKNIIHNLNYTENNISDEIIDTFVEKITVRKDVFEWKLNYLNDMNNELSNSIYNKEEDTNEKGIFLTRIIVTKDNAMEFIENNSEYINVRSDTELIADIYI